MAELQDGKTGRNLLLSQSLGVFQCVQGFLVIGARAELLFGFLYRLLQAVAADQAQNHHSEGAGCQVAGRVAVGEGGEFAAKIETLADAPA